MTRDNESRKLDKIHATSYSISADSTRHLRRELRRRREGKESKTSRRSSTQTTAAFRGLPLAKTAPGGLDGGTLAQGGGRRRGLKIRKGEG